MLIARNINATEKYSLKGDTDDPTVFILGQIDNATRAYIEDRAISFAQHSADEDAKAHISIRQRALEYVRFGLKGWTNLKDRDGLEVKCIFASEDFPHGSYQVLTKASVDCLDGAWIEELSEKLRAMAFLSEAEAKN